MTRYMASATKRAQLPANSDTVYEPPIAIQNAILTKDKKPFTYTPGMGGKLDLSQIRSPRMARRVAKNANDEGIEGPPKSALESKPVQQTTGASLFVQPQVAVPVFPVNAPPQPPVNRNPQVPILNRVPSNAGDRQVEQTTKIGAKEETKVTPIQITNVQPNTPESPGTPQVTLAKAPTPWLQNKNKQQEELPEWAKRSSVNKTANSSPEYSPSTQPTYATAKNLEQNQQTIPQWQQPQQRQQTSQQQQQRQPQPQSPPYQQKRQVSSPTVQQQQERQAMINQQVQQQERVIPIRIEDRPSVFAVKQEPGHHQFKTQPSVHHQQRWGQTSPQNQIQQPQIYIPSSPQTPQTPSYVIPVMVESDDRRTNVTPVSNVQQSNIRMNPVRGDPAKIIVQQRGQTPVQEPGPLQSRSFRVLQKITDTDSSNDVDTEQLRKLQLTEDDRILMNKFKEQVDGDNYLHQEEDPRYRGAAIPSRAFRFLQNMTDSGEISAAATMPRVQNAANKKQNRNSKTFEDVQSNLPPSEQQVPEPKKYMGSAIPSRSFRILQAMTAPENVATQENRQADYTCQTENNVPGNQHGVFIPGCPAPPPPPPYWNPDVWWGYYHPIQYPTLPNPNDPNPMKIPFDPYVYRRYEDGNAYVFYPFYHQNYIPCDNFELENNIYPQYAVHCQPPIRQVKETICKEANSNSINEENSISTSNDKNVFTEEHWRDMNDVSKVTINEKANDRLTTTLNIVEEEEERNIPKGIPGHFDKTKITVPNYTYVDSSDSSESDSESSSSSSSSSSSVSSSKLTKSRNNDTTTNDTISESDSDSYLAYSTGLNPHGKSEINDQLDKIDDKELPEIVNGQTRSENTISSCDSQNEDDEEEEENENYSLESLKSDPVIPAHRLSVIYEDTEHVEVEIPCPRKIRDSVKLNNEIPCEATDDPPDEVDTTVSVSLPLRFKFSVSENNEDVTTVIVGDSKIKSEKSRASSLEENHRSMEEETTVDFTLKRPSTMAKSTKEIEKILMNEKTEDTAHVNFTLRKVPTKVNRVNCDESIETEFTIRSKKVDVTSHVRKEKRKLDGERQKEKIVKNNQDRSSPVSIDKNDLINIDDKIIEPEIVVSECIWDEDKENSRNLIKGKKDDRKIVDEEGNSTKDINQQEDESYVELEVERNGKETKHLLSVQNSREETDDEDSGVTSDMSRMISEVDTDSECTSTKNLRKYQRTQTHSRLFRLLNDDSILTEDTTEVADGELGSSPLKREYLSLPLNTHAFNYDENYCSNYSSGLTSPEYSPICEQSWRKLNESELDSNRQHGQQQRPDRNISKDDPYYKAWKSPKANNNHDQTHEVLPSMAFKILESKIPYWTYKVNVLCPRIKSTKSVPQTLQGCKTNGSSGPSSVVRSSPTTLPLSYVENDHC
ncbi:putative mediator of RNA polymerase II transcription subunit 26 isoform X2 [Vespa crabro]|uniref:putative mediator of RNA polymerase II transcription subunit 26 isoform X2 n=1 Tax=Vespa crabro TaxID=7445 RepID=UPI001F005AC6|nr:putative mediator of RNA polymerase II transcription subunit 26 isoform X2 [Vespa crabro]